MTSLLKNNIHFIPLPYLLFCFLPPSSVFINIFHHYPFSLSVLLPVPHPFSLTPHHHTHILSILFNPHVTILNISLQCFFLSLPNLLL